MTFSIDNPKGVATTPLRKICLGKTLRRTRVKANMQNWTNEYCKVDNDMKVAFLIIHLLITKKTSIYFVLFKNIDNYNLKKSVSKKSGTAGNSLVTTKVLLITASMKTPWSALVGLAGGYV